MPEFDIDAIRPLQQELDCHAVYNALLSLEDLRVFMSHHVFSVWDFMSMIKYLQAEIAPTRVPWVPRGDPALRYFINRLVSEEESDRFRSSAGEPLYDSHFEHYCRAMREVGADASVPERFLERVRKKGVDAALYWERVPLPARYFSETTFGLIRADKPHAVAAALALGREQVIPTMFRRFLERIDVREQEAPMFYLLLQRHARMEGDFHATLSLRLMNALCGDDPENIREAETAAQEALCARIRFWDGVNEAIQTEAAGRTG